MVYTSRYISPVGPLLLAQRDGKLTGVWMEGQKYFPGPLGEEAQGRGSSGVLRQAERWLERYFAGERPDAGELPVEPGGSDFQKAVWNALCEIPYGQTATYVEISRKLAAGRGLERTSARAVGAAVGRNPISIIIPCHRVVGADGSLTGYAGGLERKIMLLTHEGVNMERLFVPRRGTAL